MLVIQSYKIANRRKSTAKRFENCPARATGMAKAVLGKEFQAKPSGSKILKAFFV